MNRINDASKTSLANESDTYRKKLKKIDRAWIFTFFGTAIGSSIIFIPIQAAVSGVYITIITMLLAFPTTYFAQKFYGTVLVESTNAASYNDAIEEYLGKGFSIFISVLFAVQLMISNLIYSTGLNTDIGE